MERRMDDNPKKPAKPQADKPKQGGENEDAQERLRFIRGVREKRETEHRAQIHRKK
jgi:hypothetical protein